jgi:hypothetical protein
MVLVVPTSHHRELVGFPPTYLNSTLNANTWLGQYNTGGRYFVWSTVNKVNLAILCLLLSRLGCPWSHPH